MFRKIEIHMAGPICTCAEADISWGVNADGDGKSGLKLSCRTCDTFLVVPHSKFVASFQWDTPYPGGKKEAEVVPLTLHKGGKDDG